MLITVTPGVRYRGLVEEERAFGYYAMETEEANWSNNKKGVFFTV